jgi:hypothetical protein
MSQLIIDTSLTNELIKEFSTLNIFMYVCQIVRGMSQLIIDTSLINYCLDKENVQDTSTPRSSYVFLSIIPLDIEKHIPSPVLETTTDGKRCIKI